MSEAAYVERLSAAQVTQRFDRSDPADRILNHLPIKVFNIDEQVVPNSDGDVNNLPLEEPSIIEIVGHNTSKAARWDMKTALSASFTNIFALRYVNIQIHAAVTTSILKPLLTSKTLVYLTMLDLSYTPLSLELIQTLGRTMNVHVSGYCPIKRLLLSRCSLGVKGGVELLENLASNIYLEELLLNGNEMTDAVIPPLLDFLNAKSVCRVSVLSLGDNKLTTLGLSRLGFGLRANCCLRELHLQDNNILPSMATDAAAPATTDGTMSMLHQSGSGVGVFDEALDGLFLTLTENPRLTVVNISNCNISNCIWGDHIRIFTTLTSLYVNNNLIDDEGCAVLCSALSINCSLRVVDMSNNVFDGHQNSNCIGSMLQTNQTLNHLFLSGNVLADDVWSSIANGLARNSTLLLLDCQWCELTVQQAQSLCHALCDDSPGTQHKGNDICSLVLTHNPLPVDMTNDPRAYSRSLRDGTAAHIMAGTSNNIVHWNATAGPAGVDVVLCPDSSIVSSTVHGSDHRRARRYEIANATEAIAILREADEATAASAAGAEVDEGVKKGEEDNVDSGTDGTRGGGETGIVDTNSLAFQIEHQTGLSIGHQEHILPGYVKTQAERRQAAQVEASVVRNRRILTVGYGYPEEVIGTIQVDHGTTYADAHRKVRPLIETYLANNNQVLVSDLLENYSFIDPNSEGGLLSVSPIDAKFRTVWAEAAMVGCVLVVRPANWVVLGDDDSDDDGGEGEEFTANSGNVC